MVVMKDSRADVTDASAFFDIPSTSPAIWNGTWKGTGMGRSYS